MAVVDGRSETTTALGIAIDDNVAQVRLGGIDFSYASRANIRAGGPCVDVGRVRRSTVDIDAIG